MQSLLRWSVENSGNSSAPSQRTDVDPGLVDYILGKPDAQLMKEAIQIATDPSKDEDTRITALDDLEMVRTSNQGVNVVKVEAPY
ncbi:hypothetical protein M404DRAFT_1004182 [Pisolithus tinctorius Marx 270]|uniref:Nucleotide exchange factor Fes1 domain-containing protein n=1 Tax=Pisolithus tinctorius Marx 270 TaxID=870435 RepID=A0A0C3NGA9_PISTI|nr:hypothetical protein M404DRAFT_1004182 [Pisolithus tinctorius Marx 270]